MCVDPHQDGSLAWLLPGGLDSSPHEPLHTASCLSLFTRQLAYPQASGLKRWSKVNATVPSVMYSWESPLFPTCSIRSESQSTGYYIQGKRNSSPPFKERSIKEFVNIF